MNSICVDTSYLISFADPSRPHHEAAVQYFRYAVQSGIRLCLSTLVISEFEVKQKITDLPLSHFEVVPFSARHAVRSAELLRKISGIPAPDDAARHVVRNDLKILAQADIEGCSVILGEDARTLTKWAESLLKVGETNVRSVLLRDGFVPDELNDPEQKGLDLGQ